MKLFILGDCWLDSRETEQSLRSFIPVGASFLGNKRMSLILQREKLRQGGCELDTGVHQD